MTLVMMLAMVGVAVLIVKWRGRKLDRGFAGATGEQVITFITIQLVITIFARQNIITVATSQSIVSGTCL